MLTLINANRMCPNIGPVGLDYVACAAREAGLQTSVLDLALADEPERLLEEHFARTSPTLVGVTFRNVDDCFWPSGTWFVPELEQLVQRLRQLTNAPIVLGGVGFSIFAERIVRQTGAEYGVRGDGEAAVVALAQALGDPAHLAQVPGLLWWRGPQLVNNAPAWPPTLSVPTSRSAIDNAAYFARGGQAGVETKRGCPRECIYCADPLAKGPRLRVRAPAEVADEFEALVRQSIDVVHLCDSEFNVPRSHALAVCEELIRRRLDRRIRWYAYATVTPFDRELAAAMRHAGCVGIDFTGDAAANAMLTRYAHPHRQQDLLQTVAHCREQQITCMIDLLLGGPGETAETVSETISALKAIGPDCVGASLGMRLYPGTPVVAQLLAQAPLDRHPSIRKGYTGPIDLFRPTFFVSDELGTEPARLVRELIGQDRRFFPPAEAAPAGHAQGDHNYNQNAPLVAAIAAGARGAYWDILRRAGQR
jgi:radical SAM superfamily enzyme YgiQ (UPF0313 family)